MTFEDWRRGEVAVVGLGRSGTAVTRLLRAHETRVYASDASATALDEAELAALRATGADVELGRHDLDRVRRASLVVVSPGVPPEAPPLRAARDAGVPIRSEVAIALAVLEGVPYVAVTGTNGKSTVTHIVGHLLGALGHDVAVAGNIGQALSEVALRSARPAWIALEVSSYQLHDTPDIAPRVGVLTNLAPDHLDRYDQVETYYADKRRLFDNATMASRWVVNADDAQAMALVADAAGNTLRFSAEGRLADAFYDRPHGALILLDAPLMRRSDLPLHGDHNVANALAAALAVSAAAPAHGSLQARKKLAGALRTVQPLPHRLATVGEIDGVLWVDDSKATNVASARVGIAAMSRPTILLLGGRHKGEPYTPLVEPIARRVRAVLAYGEAADVIVRDLGAHVPVQRLSNDFGQVVERARSLARPGDCVLLSPACASFDMFRNYEDRGRTFARLARREMGA